MSDPKNIILGMPGYGRQTSAAGRGFWRACRDQRTMLNAYYNGSLLASNFNQLWCLALNHVHEGRPLEYFAMLHDDVGPEDFWLDKLIAELEDKQLDVLSVVVPIKDSRGMTSMALQDPEDNWLPAARLTLTPDCGFAPSGTNPIPLDEPYAKLKALAEAARRLRAEQTASA